jgi:hypothetical protein
MLKNRGNVFQGDQRIHDYELLTDLCLLMNECICNPVNELHFVAIEPNAPEQKPLILGHLKHR